MVSCDYTGSISAEGHLSGSSCSSFVRALRGGQGVGPHEELLSPSWGSVAATPRTVWPRWGRKQNRRGSGMNLTRDVQENFRSSGSGSGTRSTFTKVSSICLSVIGKEQQAINSVGIA